MTAADQSLAKQALARQDLELIDRKISRTQRFLARQDISKVARLAAVEHLEDLDFERDTVTMAMETHARMAQAHHTLADEGAPDDEEGRYHHSQGEAGSGDAGRGVQGPGCAGQEVRSARAAGDASVLESLLGAQQAAEGNRPARSGVAGDQSEGLTPVCVCSEWGWSEKECPRHGYGNPAAMAKMGRTA
jgi:hypothetical protein